MTTDAFRRAALALPGAIESEHMHHPDFRVANRIFATLGYPETAWGMVKLPPDEQKSKRSCWRRCLRPFSPPPAHGDGKGQRWFG
jgi:hypothetical protein